MKKELDDKLCAKYPKIFANRTRSVYESAMYWGFCCGDGWFTIIDELCSSIQDYLDQNPNVPQVVADQVKEKFGFLCFYTSGGDLVTRKMEIDACNRSSMYCEECGSTDQVTFTTGWVRPLCINCMEKRNKKNETHNN